MAAARVVSPAYLAGAGKSLFTARRARAWYYTAFHLFWAALLALALVNNLGVAWLLIEATTGASALLVAYSGSGERAGGRLEVPGADDVRPRRRAARDPHPVRRPGAPRRRRSRRSTGRTSRGDAAGLPHRTALFALVLILAGLAAKIGWAPVHNWLPDAHSEAPPPVSALLSAALLPTVMLIAWRLVLTLGAAVPHHLADHLMLAFGLASLAIAIPFLWRPMPWKRLLAYSSLEHMGILALGIGFASPLATRRRDRPPRRARAGEVARVLHGDTAAAPRPRERASRPPRGLARLSGPVAAAAGISLGTLSGLPPSPLFLSELLILLGGVAAHQVAIVAIAAVLLALGFLGLAHALIETLAGESHGRPWRGRAHRATRRAADRRASRSACWRCRSGAYLLVDSPRRRRPDGRHRVSGRERAALAPAQVETRQPQQHWRAACERQAAGRRALLRAVRERRRAQGLQVSCVFAHGGSGPRRSALPVPAGDARHAGRPVPRRRPGRARGARLLRRALRRARAAAAAARASSRARGVDGPRRAATTPTRSRSARSTQA